MCVCLVGSARHLAFPAPHEGEGAFTYSYLLGTAHLDIIASQCHREGTDSILQIMKLNFREVITCQKLWTVELGEYSRTHLNPSCMS